MHRARTFFYVCAGLLCLALAYNLGTRNATAESPDNRIVLSLGGGYDFIAAVVTANGDVYSTQSLSGPWQLRSNVFSSATPAAPRNK